MDKHPGRSTDRPEKAQVAGNHNTSTEPTERVRVDRWNQQAWPPLAFGVPAGWSDVPVEQFTYLPVERAIAPDAPILVDTRIVAAIKHPGEQGLPWQVQLRLFERQALAAYVLEDPLRWAHARQLVGRLSRPAEQRRICCFPGVLLTYACRLDGQDLVFAEAWWAHPSAAYYFVASAPATDSRVWEPDLDAILDNVQEQAGYTHAGTPNPHAVPQPTPRGAAQQPTATTGPVVRYRCRVQTQLPYTLHNVTSAQRQLVVLGSPTTVAWSLVGMAAMAMHSHAKARSLEGQVVLVPASGELVLTDDGVALHVATGTRAGRVRLRTNSGSQSVDMDLSYRLVRRWGLHEQGVWLDVVGRATLWVHTSADEELAGWIGHLSQGRTWQPPLPMDLPVPSAIGGWCQQDPRFTFAFPPGWGLFEPGAFADYAQSFTPDLLRCGVGSDAGPWEVQMLVIDCGPASQHLTHTDPETLAAQLVEGLNPPGPLTLITLGGEPAVLARATKPTAEGLFDRTYGVVVHRGVLFAFWYGTVGGPPGDGSHERWLPDFHSILATWHWY